MISDKDLEKLKRNYSDINKNMDNVVKEIWNLEENPYVKKYIELQTKRNALDSKQRELYRLMKHEEYKNCDHLWFISMDEYEEYDYACLKCGLNKKALRLTNRGKEDSLSFGEKIMGPLLAEHDYKKGTDINLVYDIELAMAIYKKIKSYHPDIDDKTAVKYLGIALDNIRNIEVNESRKESRVKRLGLSKGFNRW